MPKENILEEKRVGVADVRYELSVGGEVFTGLSEDEVRAKLLEIDPEKKMKSSDYRVTEIDF